MFGHHQLGSGHKQVLISTGGGTLTQGRDSSPIARKRTGPGSRTSRSSGPGGPPWAPGWGSCARARCPRAAAPAAACRRSTPTRSTCGVRTTWNGPPCIPTRPREHMVTSMRACWLLQHTFLISYNAVHCFAEPPGRMKTTARRASGHRQACGGGERTSSLGRREAQEGGARPGERTGRPPGCAARPPRSRGG